MTKGINLRINVSRIDKSKLFHGKKGVYLDMTLFLEDKPNEYENNGVIRQSQTKQEREDKVQARILGDAKIFWESESTTKIAQKKVEEPKPQEDFVEDDIPF